jgi:3-oxoadipate enol-lactonase
MRQQVNGRIVSYDDAGSGPPIVLLHAFPFDRRMWWSTAAALAGHRRVIAPDLRGFGDSPGSGPFSIADLADDVAALLDVLGLSRATILGLSMGGYIALAFAARHGRRLDGLVLADTRAGADSPEGRRGRDEGIALLQAKGVDAYLDGLLPRLLAPGAPDATRTSTRALACQSAHALIDALIAMRDRPDRRGELGQIAVPTLVLVGTADGVTPPAEARAMAAAIPGARLIELPDAGHLSNLEAPAAFEAALA